MDKVTTTLAVLGGVVLGFAVGLPLFFFSPKSVMCVFDGQPSAVITPVQKARHEDGGVVYYNNGAWFKYQMRDGEVCVIGPTEPQ